MLGQGAFENTESPLLCIFVCRHVYFLTPHKHTYIKVCKGTAVTHSGLNGRNQTELDQPLLVSLKPLLF